MAKNTKKPKKSGSRIVTRWGFKKLSALKVDPALGPQDAESEGPETAAPEADAAPAPERRRKRHGTATAIVVGAAFEAATTGAVRRRLAHVQALAAIVIVPGPAWVAPVQAYVASEFGQRWCFHTRDGTERRRDDAGTVEAARDLSRGLCVMGVSHDEKLLPASLRSAADIVIRIAPPDGAVVRKAIARFARRSPGELDAGIAAGLDLPDIVAAFRPGKGATNIVRRLDAARATHAGPTGRVPDLEGAIEYGAARNFGISLVNSLNLLRENRISWRDVDRGICLYGAPGLGKTIFAQILAKACKVPLVSTSVGEWFAAGPGYLDAVIRQARGAMSRAAILACPVSILQLDEIDALPRRDAMSSHGREWWNALISDVLLMLDSTLTGKAQVVVLGCTNFIENVDPALLRPGRLEKAVEITRPDAAGALNILKFHLDGEIAGDLSDLGPLVDGMTGAELMYAVRTARRFARDAALPLAVEHLKNALLPPEAYPPARLFRMAIHESAHAVILLALAAGTVRHVRLASAGDSGGRTSVLYSDDDLATREAIEDRATVGLAARAAERLFTGSVSTGAGGAPDSDIGAVTVLVASLHASFGMRGSAVYLGAGDELLRAVAFDGELRAAVARDMRRLERRADRIVAANRTAILAVAERLAEKRHLTGAEVEALVRGRLVREPGPRRRTGTNP